MDQNSTGVMYLKIRIPKISDAKIKERAFLEPQIRELIQDINSEDQLSEAKKAPWKSFKNVTTNFL
jgi:hypothetical protein